MKTVTMLLKQKKTLNLKEDYPSTATGSRNFYRIRKQPLNGFGNCTVKEPVG